MKTKDYKENEQRTQKLRKRNFLRSLVFTLRIFHFPLVKIDWSKNRSFVVNTQRKFEGKRTFLIPHYVVYFKLFLTKLFARDFLDKTSRIDRESNRFTYVGSVIDVECFQNIVASDHFHKF